MVDEKAIKKAVEEIIKAIGDNPQREGLLDTPKRVAEMYGELFAGMSENPAEQLKVDYEVAAARRYPEQVVIALAKDSNGQIDPITIGWTMTASRKPPMIAISVAKQRYFLRASRWANAFVVCYPRWKWRPSSSVPAVGVNWTSSLNAP